ncbi:MAG: hypothetical protein AB8G15_19085, partial [Saprospiraceae bacterium]
MKIFRSLTQLLGIVCCLFLSQTIFAQTNFYYSPEGKTFLQVSTEKIIVKFEEGTSLEMQQQVLNSEAKLEKLERTMLLPAPEVTLVNLNGINNNQEVAALLKRLQKHPKIIYANAFLAHQDGTLHGIQEKILVRLKSNKDMASFNQAMDKFEVVVDTRNEFDPLLFHISVLPTSKLNALELANAWHESGQFDYAEPDFMYYNNGDGTFTNVINQKLKHITQLSMGSDTGDINN